MAYLYEEKRRMKSRSFDNFTVNLAVIYPYLQIYDTVHSLLKLLFYFAKKH